METLRRLIHPVVRVVDAQRGIVDYVASTETVDSFKEVIRADGWRFTQFRKNAPFVDSHDYSSIDKILGKVIDFRVEGGKLIERVQWAIDAPDNRLAKLGFQLTQGGYLKAVSVGFQPVQTVSRYDTDPKAYREQLKQLGLSDADGIKSIYLKQEQVELSAVVLGANPDALQAARNADVITRADFEFATGSSRQPASCRNINIPFPEAETHNAMNISESPRERLLAAFDQFTPETKSTFDRLTTLKNHGGSDQELRRALRAAMGDLGREERLAFGDPVQRIAADPELNFEINCVMRRLLLPRAKQPERFRALGEDATPGSTYVTPVLGTMLYDLLSRYGAWTTLGVQPITSGTAKFPYLTARPKAVFVLADGTLLDDDTNAAGSSESGKAEFIASLLHVSDAWLEDADADLSKLFLDTFEQACNERLDTACFNGNGVADADNGGMTGIFQHADPTISAAANGNTTIEALDYEDLVNVLIATPAGILQRAPRWWANPTSLARLMKVKDNSGAPVVRTPVEQPGRGIASILGFPVVPCAAAPSANVAGSKVAAFGDGNAYAIGLRKAFTLERGRPDFDRFRSSIRAVSRARGQMVRGAGFTILQLAAA